MLASTSARHGKGEKKAFTGSLDPVEEKWVLQGGFPYVPFKTLCMLFESLNPPIPALPLEENPGLLSLFPILHGGPHWAHSSLQVPLWHWGTKMFPVSRCGSLSWAERIIWATWSRGWHPCPCQRDGMKWSLRSFPTKISLGFHGSVILPSPQPWGPRVPPASPSSTTSPSLFFLSVLPTWVPCLKFVIWAYSVFATFPLGLHHDSLSVTNGIGFPSKDRLLLGASQWNLDLPASWRASPVCTLSAKTKPEGRVPLDFSKHGNNFGPRPDLL